MTSTSRALAGPFQRPVPPWIGDVVATVLVLAPTFARYPGSPAETGNLVGLVAGIGGAAVMPFRRRWPIPVLAICIALFGLAAFTGTIAPGLVLASAIAMFAVAVRNDRRRTIIVAAIAAVTILGLGLLAGIGSVFDPRAFQLAVTIAFAAAAGDAARSHRAYIDAITERAVRAEETRESEARRRVTEDRLRIARDLHDTVAHQISVISLNAGVASSALESRPEVARDALAAIRSASRTVLGEIGDLLSVLRAESDDPLSNAPSTAPQPGLGRLGELIARFAQTGLDVTVRVEGDPRRLPDAVDRVAYRVIQEALTNAHKHGSEHRAHLLVEVTTDAARIVVTNPAGGGGIGGDIGGGGDERAGHGLLGIRERVTSVRGAVESGATAGGYRLAAMLPLPADDDRGPEAHGVDADADADADAGSGDPTPPSKGEPR